VSGQGLFAGPVTDIEYLRSLRSYFEMMFKKFTSMVIVSLALAMLSGCSATSLRCGVSDDASYVDLVNVPQDLSANARYFAELCGFAYETDESVQ
jgi:hypothetical protein